MNDLMVFHKYFKRYFIEKKKTIYTNGPIRIF